MAEWTADQLKLIALQRELSGLFQLCQMKKVPTPPDDVLLDFRKLVKFREQLASEDVATQTQHTHGWKVG